MGGNGTEYYDRLSGNVGGLGIPTFSKEAELQSALYLVSRQRHDEMFSLNIMRRMRYDEVTTYRCTGSTDESHKSIPS